MKTARDITKALGGKWYNYYGTAPCPVCQKNADKTHNALTISDGNGKLLMHCKKSNCDFKDLVIACGLDLKCPQRRTALPRYGRANRTPDYSKFAKKAWDEGQPVQGTPAETYLRKARGLTGPYPDSLRFHLSLWHGPLQQNFPALIARIDGCDGFSINRTFLRPDGYGKAEIDKALQKVRLGRGRGGHVSIATGPGPLIVAEGIETAMSYFQFRELQNASAWAPLGTSAMKSLELPLTPQTLVIAADGDREGRIAAEALRSKALRRGWIVKIDAAPPGKDWNDVLLDQ